MDPIDTMTELRSKQSKGAKWTGMDVRKPVVADMFKQDVLEPVIVKEQIIKSATETACMILRVDNVIASSKSKTTLCLQEWCRWNGRNGRMGME